MSLKVRIMIELFLVVVAAAAGFTLGRITAPDRIVDRIVERVAAPVVSAIADRVDQNKQLMLDVKELGRQNKLCAEQLGTLRERTRTAQIAAQRAKDNYDRTPVSTPYETPAAQVWADQPVPAEVATSLSRTFERFTDRPECVPERADHQHRNSACSAPAERDDRSHSPAEFVPQSDSSSSSYESSSSSSYDSSSSSSYDSSSS